MKNPGTAAVLSFFIPGVGQIYNGTIWRGIFWLIITPGFWLGTGGLLGLQLRQAASSLKFLAALGLQFDAHGRSLCAWQVKLGLPIFITITD
jgi:hypothetical protein